MEPGPIKNPALRPSIQNFTGEQFLGEFLPNLITLGFIIASIALLFVLLIGGIEWITSGGDKSKVESARGRLTSALIGFLIVGSIFAIISVVENLLGIDILTIDLDVLRIGETPALPQGPWGQPWKPAAP